MKDSTLRTIVVYCEKITALVFGVHTVLMYSWWFTPKGMLFWLINAAIAYFFNWWRRQIDEES